MVVEALPPLNDRAALYVRVSTSDRGCQPVEQPLRQPTNIALLPFAPTSQMTARATPHTSGPVGMAPLAYGVIDLIAPQPRSEAKTLASPSRALVY